MRITSSGRLSDDMREYLQESPAKLRLAFRNCQMSPSELSELCELLGECGVGSLSFQQRDFGSRPLLSNPDAGSILDSTALQQSRYLRSLELDCPFFPESVAAAARFLARSENSAELVIHLRREWFAGNARAAQSLCSKLTELCASAQGARLKIVPHQRPSRLQAKAAKETVDDRGRQRPVVRKPAQCLNARPQRLRYRCLRPGAGKALGKFKLLGIKLWPYGIAGATAVRTLWPSVRATLQGKPSWLGIAFGLLGIGMFPFSLVIAAFRSFWAYIGVCLLWTIVRQLFGAVRFIVSRRNRRRKAFLELD
ncbi:hypothetical protein KFL_005370020 [Klebsormidium nitens]|uniref:Uncharacterized protein n=1 Tax=Klebsormidium nitens TaxID=105231 RepID=A0A1Y1IFA9_KLENI|nr:hypothetical protein KFL_005370020 [Klebsormidium nitens]|eukprot:GAQ89565.1 hypothetical protein KFL_005370020 [Klebsormidium nitens]